MEHTISADLSTSGYLPITYNGEDISKLVRAIKYLSVDKNMPFPLLSHHGTDFLLPKFGGIRMTVLSPSWTHHNKGNGPLSARIYIKDDNWVHTINSRGYCESKSGLLIGEGFGEGFVKIMEKSGFHLLSHATSKGSVHVDLHSKFNFSSRTILDGEKKEVTNMEFDAHLHSFIQSLRDIFEHYEILK